MTQDKYNGPMPFKNSEYYFKVGLGEVANEDEIKWIEWIEIEGYNQLLLILKMWDLYADYPAVEIKTWYREEI